MRHVGRFVPLVALAVLAVLIWSRAKDWGAERLWAEMQAAYDTKDATQLDPIEQFIDRYPNSPHIADARYYYASLAHDAKGCEIAVPIWQTILDSENPERRAEAATRLGDCAVEAGDATLALSYYRQVAEQSPASAEWSARAAMKAGRVAEEEHQTPVALSFFKSIPALPATDEEIVEAHRSVGTIYLSRVNETAVAHRIRRGETLWRISWTNGLTVSDMMTANPKLTDPNRIVAGDTLSIPIRRFSLLLSVAERTLYLLHDSHAVRPYPAAVDATIKPGVYRVTSKERRVERLASTDVSNETVGTGTRYIGIQGGAFAIQGGANGASIRSDGAKNVVRLVNADCEELYGLIPVGAEIRVEPETPQLVWLSLSENAGD